MKPKAVIFDIGGVLDLPKHSTSRLRNHDYGIHEYLAKKFKLDIDTWFDTIDSPYTKSIEGKIARQKAISIISKNLKTTPKKFQKYYKKAYKQNYKKNKKLYKTAFALKNKGYKIGVLSDQWYLSKDSAINKKIIKKFDIVIISCDVGLRKPNPKIYKLLIKKLKKYKIKPREILFIDNHDWNLKPAKKLGIQTILFRNNKQLIKELKKIKIL